MQDKVQNLLRRSASIAGVGASVLQSGVIGKVGDFVDQVGSVARFGAKNAATLYGAAGLADGLAARRTEYSAKTLKHVIQTMEGAQHVLQKRIAARSRSENPITRPLRRLLNLTDQRKYYNIDNRKACLKEARDKKVREERTKSLEHGLKLFGVAGAAAVVGISVASSLAKYYRNKRDHRAYTEVAASLGEAVETELVPLVGPEVDYKLVQLLPDDCKYDKDEILTRLRFSLQDSAEVLQILTAMKTSDEQGKKRLGDDLDAKLDAIFRKPFDIRDGDMKKYGQDLEHTRLARLDKDYGRSKAGTVYCIEGCDNLVRMFTSRANDDKLWQKMWDSFMRDSRLNLDTTNRLRAAHGTVNRALEIVQASSYQSQTLGDIVTGELNKALPVADSMIKVVRGVCEIDKHTTDYKFPQVSQYLSSLAETVCVAGLKYGVRGTRPLRPIKENF